MMSVLTVKNFNLPTPPAIALRILEVIKKGDASFIELARIIEVDPALTAKILKVANSSFYSMPNSVHTIEKALSVLGINITKNIALSFAIAKDMRGSDDTRFDFTYFWKRAVTTAVGAELLASLLHYKNDELFVSALLQDIGVLVMYLSRPEEYSQVLDEKRVSGTSILGIEQKVFGFDHQEAGAELLARWGLSETLSTLIRYHHRSDCPEEMRTPVNLLHWSAMLASIYYGLQSVEKVQRLKAEICPIFRISAEEIDTLVDSVAKKSLELLSFFEIDPGEMKPFSLLLQDANEELQRINLSYEHLVMQAKQARAKAEELAAELLEANNKLRVLAFRDGLTGLYNFRYFQELMERETSRATRYHLPLSLMFFDIDHFKEVNDTYGHPAGDEVLRCLAKLVTTTMRTSDIIARYGGEEFAVILPMTDMAGCRVFAERLRRLVEDMKMVIGGILLRITISLGVTTCESGMVSMNKSQMIKAVDEAMYLAKKKGRNRVEVRELQP
ncbi:MAG: GGDEF domain-containing protein [Desulfocapsa sp.]|nr:GGDEF domain-containing protein [Desulfocapsa sp.]MBU3983340.1 GGDEF domain-containing protein [Pseudomonadota bacterium]MBU4084377.1 GGDEF domain-containing protein [Pseudomonadota bacterium]MCG2742443.1 GGDEF domain-containing protein [Desulfobacteraceae bacterium]